jgi:hypothetical protein
MPIRQKIAPRGCLTPHTILLAAALTFPSQIFAQTLKPKSVEGTDRCLCRRRPVIMARMAHCGWHILRRMEISQ